MKTRHSKREAGLLNWCRRETVRRYESDAQFKLAIGGRVILRCTIADLRRRLALLGTNVTPLTAGAGVNAFGTDYSLELEFPRFTLAPSPARPPAPAQPPAPSPIGD